VIESWERARVLAPHTHDGELGGGGTIARMVDAGGEVG
jgi:LmbE family N-acetylglucosaminyl deacetylase